MPSGLWFLFRGISAHEARARGITRAGLLLSHPRAASTGAVPETGLGLGRAGGHFPAATARSAAEQPKEGWSQSVRSQKSWSVFPVVLRTVQACPLSGTTCGRWSACSCLCLPPGSSPQAPPAGVGVRVCRGRGWCLFTCPDIGERAAVCTQTSAEGCFCSQVSLWAGPLCTLA